MRDFDPLSGHNQVMVDTFMCMTMPAQLEQPELQLAGRAVRGELGNAPFLPAGNRQNRNIPVDECARAAQLNEPKG